MHAKYHDIILGLTVLLNSPKIILTFLLNSLGEVCYTIQYNTIQYNTIQYNTIQYKFYLPPMLLSLQEFVTLYVNSGEAAVKKP